MPNQSHSPQQKPTYQSPIALSPNDYINISQHIEIYGRNEDATFNHATKNFEVHKKVIITINHKQYRLEEYHFHTPSEHTVNGEKYAAEIHYVFIENSEHDEHKVHNERECYNVCGCSKPHDKNIIVIARVIINAGHHKHLKDIQVKVPHYYYQYDGSLTTGLYSPVCWIVGETPVHYDLKQLTDISKDARPLQELNGRIILFSEKK